MEIILISFYSINVMNKIEIYRMFFLFVVAYSTFTLVYTTYNFLMVNTFDFTTLVIRAFALCLIIIMFIMYLDTTKNLK